jgi:hypothetical protein
VVEVDPVPDSAGVPLAEPPREIDDVGVAVLVEDTLAVVDVLSLPVGDGEGVTAAVPVPVAVGVTVAAAVFVVVPVEEGVGESDEVVDALTPSVSEDVCDRDRVDDNDSDDDGVIDGVRVPELVDVAVDVPVVCVSMSSSLMTKASTNSRRCLRLKVCRSLYPQE